MFIAVTADSGACEGMIEVEQTLDHDQIGEAHAMFAEATLVVENGFRREPGANAMIDERSALKDILRQVEIVAPTDATVLLQGETGMGKELIAHAVHSQSGRRHHPFVTVNDAAIPSGLLESELFGHERGAFTGAIAQNIGRFERPHRERSGRCASHPQTSASAL